MADLILKEECYAIVGAAMEVHRTLGCGFLEAVYQEALEIELKTRNIPFVAQAELHITYKGQQLTKTYIADFICYEQIIVEIKVLPVMTTKEDAQVINYLYATDRPLGLLLNFGAESLQWRRLVHSTPVPPLKIRANSRN